MNQPEVSISLLPNGVYGIGTFKVKDQELSRSFPGLLLKGKVLDLSSLGRANNGGDLSTFDIFANWSEWELKLEGLSQAETASWLDLAHLVVEAPLIPGEVFQSGANYKRHVIELIAAEKQSAHGATPEEARADAEKMMSARVANGIPYVFLGTRRSICGPFDDVVIPKRGDQHDWELELALVIGKFGRFVEEKDAMSIVAGYTIANDISTRDQLYRPDLKAIGTDWFSSKNAPTFLPLGPYVVPAKFVANPGDLNIHLEHNSIVRQNESTSDMIFNIPRLISYISGITELHPGDLILTGSPAGNGANFNVFLKPGDQMTGSITGLGHQHNVCVDEKAR
jgi:2-keto-4-pentenoate hydratase/2-oxohepta-3-ene-1,7-dioic acid hydratase in catechol pathway